MTTTINKQAARAWKAQAEALDRRRNSDSPDTAEMLRHYQQREAAMYELLGLPAGANLLAEIRRIKAALDLPIRPPAEALTAVTAYRWWSAKQVAQESGVSVSTVCRRAREIEGAVQTANSVWHFPVGSKLTRKRR